MNGFSIIADIRPPPQKGHARSHKNRSRDRNGNWNGKSIRRKAYSGSGELNVKI
jgi:hypothetical protein